MITGLSPAVLSIPLAERAPRVLVVEDDADQRALLAIHLRRGGCAVSTASTGEDALDLLDLERFDLAILDVHLPGISGPVIGRVLRHRQPACAVVLTSVLDPDDLPVGERVLFKPFTRAEVFRLIPGRQPAFLPAPRSGDDR